ncbi:phage head-tail adapter protein [Enterococcus mundtii]|uniref:phage head-tail adapter protein n=1 Tax=Enterococcus TaxID=1350 RepID=UPI000E1B8966|nr:phage head-tail adapter protein [Enterococcus mundtii]
MRKLPINSKYKRPDIVAGDLNTPVTFFEFKPSDGPEPGDEKRKELYYCTALVYNPSMKDRNILGSKEGVTIKIRDPQQSYIASNKHKVEIEDYRYKGKTWEIVDVSLDLEDNSFVKLVLELIT